MRLPTSAITLPGRWSTAPACPSARRSWSLTVLHGTVTLSAPVTSSPTGPVTYYFFGPVVGTGTVLGTDQPTNTIQGLDLNTYNTLLKIGPLTNVQVTGPGIDPGSTVTVIKLSLQNGVPVVTLSTSPGRQPDFRGRRLVRLHVWLCHAQSDRRRRLRATARRRATHRRLPARDAVAARRRPALDLYRRQHHNQIYRRHRGQRQHLHQAERAGAPGAPGRLHPGKQQHQPDGHLRGGQLHALASCRPVGGQPISQPVAERADRWQPGGTVVNPSGTKYACSPSSSFTVRPASTRSRSRGPGSGSTVLIDAVGFQTGGLADGTATAKAPGDGRVPGPASQRLGRQAPWHRCSSTVLRPIRQSLERPHRPPDPDPHRKGVARALRAGQRRAREDESRCGDLQPPGHQRQAGMCCVPGSAASMWIRSHSTSAPHCRDDSPGSGPSGADQRPWRQETELTPFFYVHFFHSGQLAAGGPGGGGGFEGVVEGGEVVFEERAEGGSGTPRTRQRRCRSSSGASRSGPRWSTSGRR